MKQSSTLCLIPLEAMKIVSHKYLLTRLISFQQSCSLINCVFKRDNQIGLKSIAHDA